MEAKKGGGKFPAAPDQSVESVNWKPKDVVPRMDDFPEIWVIE